MKLTKAELRILADALKYHIDDARFWLKASQGSPYAADRRNVSGIRQKLRAIVALRRKVMRGAK